MNTSPSDEPNEPAAEADSQANAMTDQLRKDVATWNRSRSGDAADPDAKFTVPVTKPAASPPAARVTRRKAKPAEAEKPVVTEKKPFRMSYDGTTDKDYIAQRVKLAIR
jgi:hypothetical protein